MSRANEIEQKIREIVTSKELSSSEKLDQLHALIPPETFAIDSTIMATPEQMKLLRDGLAVSSTSSVPISWQTKLSREQPTRERTDDQGRQSPLFSQSPRMAIAAQYKTPVKPKKVAASALAIDATDQAPNCRQRIEAARGSI